MQAIHNSGARRRMPPLLFQRAKIQDKCKQFTTSAAAVVRVFGCFKEQRYKINASNSQLRTIPCSPLQGCFKEQRYKINASNSQHYRQRRMDRRGCFKEQRYKINASNSQRPAFRFLSKFVVSKSKDTR